MRRFIFGAAILVSVLLSIQAFGQSNARVDGIIMDATQAVLPGVALTATNVETGISKTTVSNAAGVYSIVGLQVGMYTVKAELAGFQTAIFKDVKLGNDARIALNITMAIKAIEQKVEVSVQSENLLIESSSSVGMVLPEKRVSELPLVNSNVLSLIKVMGGVTMTENPIFGADDTQFAGVSASNVNLQRDGITVNDVRYATGLNSPVYLNPEMVGEFKLVLAPVDAEMGRGAGQVQIVTRSGANAFHGSAVWNVQNTALDAMEWIDNRRAVPKDWRNQNEYTVSVGGPIIKNKTFFFASWDQQFSRIRQNNINSLVPTACARKGIFRWQEGWSGGNVLTNTDLGSFFSAAVTRTVEADGSPRTQPFYQPDGTTVSNLRYASVFTGMLLKNPTTNDCSDVTIGPTGIPTAEWASQTLVDPRRTPDADPALGSGYVERFMEMIPAPNNYQIGDGLNWGGHRWVRRLNGGDNIYGLGEGPNRKQINFRIDHNFSTSHRISGTYGYESDVGEDSFPTMPKGLSRTSYGGGLLRKPQSFSIHLTSTIRPTLLNEARVGLSRTASFTYDPLFNPLNKGKLREELLDLYPNPSGIPVLIGLGNPGFRIGDGAPGAMHVWGNGRGNLASTWGGTDPRWTYADTITWTKGKHSLKFGAEMQRTSSYQEMTGTISFGAGSSGIPQATNSAYLLNRTDANTGFHFPWGASTLPGQVGAINEISFFSSGNVLSGTYNLLNILSGNVDTVRQWRFVNQPQDETFNNIGAGQDRRISEYFQNQLSFFVKDDWKISDSLTLNLGVRWEYYGVPYLAGGKTAGIDGGSFRAFGISGGDSWSDWMVPGTRGEPARIAFIGPGSPNPDQQLYRDDYTNFGPAVGFAWQLPWLGKGKTTIRGGYQMTFMPPGRAGFALDNVPAMAYENLFTPTTTDLPYLNLKLLAQTNIYKGGALLPVLPLPSFVTTPEVNPEPRVTQRSQFVNVYDPNLSTPYVQNLTLSITRNIGANLTIDARYIGTLSRKQMGSFNLNSPNIWSNGLKEAFDAARAGEDNVPLLDQMFAGINLGGNGGFGAPGYGPVGTTFNGVFQTGAMHLRANQSTQGQLATGNYIGLANTLATLNWVPGYFGNEGLPTIDQDTRGTILRYNNFPENFIYTSPQFGSVNWNGNLNHSNYHSMQVQVTLRPVQGFSFSGTYTWSRNLGDLGTYTDPRFRNGDYGLNGMHRAHSITTNGAYELPFGPGKWFLNSNNGIVSRIAAGWNLSWIASYATGRPFSMTSTTQQLYANGVPNLLPGEEFDRKAGRVVWPEDATAGNYWWDTTLNGPKYTLVADPQCSTITSKQGLNGAFSCNLQALALASDPTHLIMVNPGPTEKGNFSFNSLTGLGAWSADVAMSKAIRISEGKTIQIRVDATNIFNHQQPTTGSFQSGVVRVRTLGNPVAQLSGNFFDFTDFSFAQRPPGYLSAKAGARTFQAKLRFDF